MRRPFVSCRRRGVLLCQPDREKEEPHEQPSRCPPRWARPMTPPRSSSRCTHWWEARGLFQAAHRPGAKALCHLHAAAQRHRRAAPGPCHHRRGRGCADPLPPHDGPAHAVGARHATMPASPPRTWWSASWPRRASPATTWAARSSSSACGSGSASTTRASPSSTARLGVSCDWERERFTMDEGLSRAVREAFVRLYERGPDLSRRLPGELVPALRHGHLRPGGGARGRGCAPLVRALLDRGPQPLASPWPPRAPRRSWAIPPWPCTPRTSATATWWACRCALPVIGRADPHHRRRGRGPGLWHRRRQGDARRTTRWTMRSASATACRSST